MKSKFIVILISIVWFSCSSRHDDESVRSSEMKTSDSMQLTPSEEYDELSTSAPASTDDGISNEKNKMEKKDVTTGGVVTKKSEVTLTQKLEKLADTIYLKNVRLSKKFIKTAELRFKVKNVEQVTHTIESITKNLDGYVQQSNIKSEYVSGRDVELNSDSMLSVFVYHVNNQLIIRVPSIYFDSVLTEISKLHIYLDYRNIKTEDVSTTFLRNKLKAEKDAEYEKRIQKASDQGNRRLDDIVDAEMNASQLAERAIDKKIANYELQDRIDFSTITMDIYQANSTYQEKVKNTRLYEYKPSFWQRAWEAINTGWEVILDVLIGIIYLWPLYLLAVLVYFGIKYFRKKFKKTV